MNPKFECKYSNIKIPLKKKKKKKKKSTEDYLIHYNRK